MSAPVTVTEATASASGRPAAARDPNTAIRITSTAGSPIASAAWMSSSRTSAVASTNAVTPITCTTTPSWASPTSSASRHLRRDVRGPRVADAGTEAEADRDTRAPLPSGDRDLSRRAGSSPPARPANSGLQPVDGFRQGGGAGVRLRDQDSCELRLVGVREVALDSAPDAVRSQAGHVEAASIRPSDWRSANGTEAATTTSQRTATIRPRRRATSPAGALPPAPVNRTPVRRLHRAREFDVIVVGAGPAGSTSAYFLCSGGALGANLLDRAGFPRDKPCGGGVTGRAAALLPFSIDLVVEDVVHRLEIGLSYARRFERQSEKPLIYMTRRVALDAFLVQQAREAGAVFRDATKVTEVELRADDVVVKTKDWTGTCRVVIGADGTNGVTARALGCEGARMHLVALEADLSYDAVDRDRYRAGAVLQLGAVPGGYGWIFPKGDHVNVGVGGWETKAPAFAPTSRSSSRATGSTAARSRTCAATGFRCAGPATA